jgi:hypothetical protein
MREVRSESNIGTSSHFVSGEDLLLRVAYFFVHACMEVPFVIVVLPVGAKGCATVLRIMSDMDGPVVAVTP